MLPAMLVTGLVVTIGAATLTNRALSLRLGEGLQDQANEARDAADSGFEAVIAELNRKENRQLAASNVSMNNWGATGASVLNPCLQNTDGSPANLSPTSRAVSLSNGEWQTLPNNPNMRYRIRSARVKRADRLAWMRTQLSSTGGSATVTTSTEPYDPIKIRENANPTEQFSRLDLTIEGQSLRDGVAVSSRVITQELGVVPKCCGASIGDSTTPIAGTSNSLMAQACASRFPSLLIGLNGGGVLRAGSGAQLRELPVGSLVLANPPQKPARLLCVNNSGTCGGNVTTSVDGVPIQTIRLTPPPPPPYPAVDNRTNTAPGINGFAIVSNSNAEAATLSAPTDTRSQPHQDYLRVNSSGTVELCNVFDNNKQKNVTPNMPQALVPGSCDNRINSFCARTGTPANFDYPGSPSNYTYHCRISRLHVRDSSSANSDDDRLQNNTFFIDSSRGRIFLHFNAAWISPATCGITAVNPTQDAICTQSGYDDGQIQHLYCATPPSDSNPCATKADPDDAPRAVLYSDTTTSLKIGDAGFIRDLFVYMPKGTLTLAEDPNFADNAFGAPNFRGPLWIDNLSMGTGINASYQTQINAPAFSSNFQGLGTPTVDNPFRLLPFFEWIVRGSSLRILYGTS